MGVGYPEQGFVLRLLLCFARQFSVHKHIAIRLFNEIPSRLTAPERRRIRKPVKEITRTVRIVGPRHPQPRFITEGIACQEIQTHPLALATALGATERMVRVPCVPGITVILPSKDIHAHILAVTAALNAKGRVTRIKRVPGIAADWTVHKIRA